MVNKCHTAFKTFMQSRYLTEVLINVENRYLRRARYIKNVVVEFSSKQGLGTDSLMAMMMTTTMMTMMMMMPNRI